MAHCIYYPELLHAHRTPNGHPEFWTRLKAIQEGLDWDDCAFIEKRTAPVAELDLARTLHTDAYLEMLALPFDDEEPIRSLDGMDTWLDHDSLKAALAGLGASLDAIKDMAAGDLKHAFVATRPPGHHALSDAAMGFCLLGSAALAAVHARDTYGYRVAVLDFDLHHGNGTEALLLDQHDVFFASTQEKNQWPMTSATGTTGKFGHLHNIDLNRRTGTREMEAAWIDLLDRMRAFEPDLVIVSAGFDAHQHDPLSGLRWQTHSYPWLAARIGEAANVSARGGVLSILEGGYEQSVLRKCVPLYMKAMAATLTA
ncbi:histone deacetylase family protein [Loktanella sp. DJP18]|uniref:histone deacetylase family protein n=1 Tax=Loktanella sp. DJP18 TaxID=3409788 RepID=UPI003BB7FE85